MTGLRLVGLRSVALIALVSAVGCGGPRQAPPSTSTTNTTVPVVDPGGKMPGSGPPTNTAVPATP